MSQLKSLQIKRYTLESGVVLNQVNVSYQIFGQKLHTAPIVLVNHALTGNSNVTGSASAWWSEIVGKDKVINTKKYTIVAIDIIGNGFNGNLISAHKAFIARDVANLFITVVESLNIKSLFAVIGGSIGGCIAWEMAILKPRLIEYLIPIASDWKASDWIIGQNYVQECILNNSKEPLRDARKMAMLFYRTPASFAQKFKRSKSQNSQEVFKVESWLDYHGNALESRFELAAYQMVNHLLTTVDITAGKGVFNHTVSQLKSKVIQIGIDTDLFFVADENKKTKASLDLVGIKNEYYEINSIHGHDAFLIENEQLTNILGSIFNHYPDHK